MQFRLFLLLILSILFGCYEREYPQPFPIAITYEVVNISSEGAEFRGSIESLGTDQKVIKYGFVWGEETKPTINSSFITFSDNFKLGTFSKVINYDLAKDQVYYVRGFIQTENLIVYGNVESFISQGSNAPEITEISPEKGTDGSEITIKGNYFSNNPARNFVTIGDQTANIISSTETEIKFVSPISPLIGDFDLTVEVAGKKTTALQKFSIRGPRINSLSKSNGRVGDLLIATGEYFADENSLSLFFGSIIPYQQYENYSQTYILSTTELECYVPDYVGRDVNLELYSYSPLFGPLQKKHVFPQKFTILNSWNNISNQVPLERNYPGLSGWGYKSTQINNLVYVMGGKTMYEYNINTNVWTRKADFPGEYRYFGTAFSYQNKVYYGFGEAYYDPPFVGRKSIFPNDLWIYDPTNNTWTKQLDSPFPGRRNAISFVINDHAYVGLGFSDASNNVVHHIDIWSFNPTTGNWSSIPVPFTKSVSRATSFVVNNKAYLVGVEESRSRYSDVWEFDPASSSWSVKSPLPEEMLNEGATASSQSGYVIATINGYGNRPYEYDPNKDRWIKRQSLYSTSAPFQFAHYHNNKLVYCAGTLWQLDF